MPHSPFLPWCFGCRGWNARRRPLVAKALLPGIVTLRTTAQRKVEDTAEFVDALLQAAFELGEQSAVSAFAFVNHAEVIVGHYVFGCEGRGKLKVLAGLCELSRRNRGKSKAVERADRKRIISRQRRKAAAASGMLPRW